MSKRFCIDRITVTTVDDGEAGAQVEIDRLGEWVRFSLSPEIDIQIIDDDPRERPEGYRSVYMTNRGLKFNAMIDVLNAVDKCLRAGLEENEDED